MRIGVISAGDPPAEIGSDFPSYSRMIHAALGLPQRWREFNARSEQLPDRSSDCDAFIITGSASGVHDPDPWIRELRSWLQAQDPAVPIVGICFGHQIMAEAYGGRVQRSKHGWALGLREYRIAVLEPWMDSAQPFTLPVSHRDQVVLAPEQSRVIATSSFCPYAALSYSSRRALSFQAHPEFSLEYIERLIDLRSRNGLIGTDQTELARRTLARTADGSRVMRWIWGFIAQSASSKPPNSLRSTDSP